MDTARRFRKSVLVLSLSVTGVALVPAGALGQVRERDVTITGPRGRTIERHLESRLGPNGLTRDMTITRPGGTYRREAVFSGAPAFRPGPGPRPPVILERNVFVGGGGPGISPLASFGLGAALGTGAGVLLDRTLAPPPPPVVVASPMVVAPLPPPTVIYNTPPVAYAQPPVQQTVVVDQVAIQTARFSSSHVASRREAAAVLGRLGDPRAIPALVERLKLDSDKTVRITAANSIAQIGDPKSAIYLERASIYDKRQDVRDAAAAALARMPKEVVVPQATASTSPGISIPPLSDSERIPPPPPTPANGLRR